MQQSPVRGPHVDDSVSAYYAALTKPLLKYMGGTLAAHGGLWGPDTTSHRQAYTRANCTLVQGCDLDPGKWVLDAGCGVGGTAIWLAQTYGVHVTGLTNCEPHVSVARDLAEERGVGHLVEFRHGDFMDLPFPDACFDAVFNQESFCYAPDKLAYLQGVYRVLKPGGRWQGLDIMRSGAPLSESQEAIHASLQYSCRTPSLVSWRDVLAVLDEAGFEEIRERDLDSEVAPSLENVRKLCFLSMFLIPSPSEENRVYHEFMQAALDFDQGLREGVFTYRFVAGAKPAS
ncbi:MAG: methyltransferase domain-containing protein [Nitrospira sp.]|nr:methyltransferase domain-containing protein [Nitrospira sp.]